ncbi:hypothetical protein [Phyllobacterium chamaecytisi]|uniref:hypothetical protein n=1 Tax=Phyllobacterium chamaecytisi TaxID=2876082 RepID=UPI001CCDFD6B|nr:hypothetical protein [Phyllobacterium sp. KW56]MBZ9605023.1 hypothetical protein [Phyllobacterium sp. KW56]
MTQDNTAGEIDPLEGSPELKADLSRSLEFIAALQNDHMMWTAYNLLIQNKWVRPGGTVAHHIGTNGSVGEFIAKLRGKGETCLSIQCYGDDGPPFEQSEKWEHVSMLGELFSQLGWVSDPNQERQVLIRFDGPLGTRG